MRSEPLALRFERHYIPEPNSGCFLWTGAVNLDGYGWIGEGAPSRKILAAHRVSWEINKGPVPPGMHVLHRCDNPPCVNSDHLFLGTHQENIADCKAKGRLNRTGARGTAQHLAKLTEQQVKEIKSTKFQYGMQRALADKFDVSAAVIHNVRIGHTWKHIPRDEGVAGCELKPSRHVAKLTERQVREIRASTETLRALAEIHNVTIQSIWAVRTGKTWKHVQ